jgi:hypothetical protein
MGNASLLAFFRIDVEIHAGECTDNAAKGYPGNAIYGYRRIIQCPDDTYVNQSPGSAGTQGKCGFFLRSIKGS